MEAAWQSEGSETVDSRSREPASVAATKIPSPAALRIENAIVLVVVLVPFIALVGAAWRGIISGLDVTLFVGMYLFSTFGITIGFHRLFTHRSFECSTGLKAMLAIAGSMAVQGPVIRWVADHRRHHAFSDAEGDPHSPQLRTREGAGEVLRHLWHAHVGWFFSPEKTRVKKFAPDLLADSTITRIDSFYVLWVALSLAIPSALGGIITHSWTGAVSGLLWGGLARICVVHHVTWSINSICHVFGKRPYESRDRSTNNAWLSILSLGESWHNAHHAFPTSAVHGLGKYEVDLSAMVIRGFELTGLAWNVKRPSPAQLARRTVSIRSNEA